MNFNFDKDIEIVSQNSNEFITQIQNSWSIDDNPNGGYLVAVVLQALRQTFKKEDPLTVTAHFLRPGLGGTSGKISTEVIRSGRRITVGRGRLNQDGLDRLEVLAAFGEIKHPLQSVLSIQPPVIPAPEDCFSRSLEDQGVILHIDEKVEVRLAEESFEENSRTCGWIRFRDNRPPDLSSLVLFSDAFPPAVFKIFGRVGWVPTIELTVHFRSHPAPGWILGEFFTDDLSNGTMIETGSLWDSTGSLVARSRQLALVSIPK